MTPATPAPSASSATPLWKQLLDNLEAADALTQIADQEDKEPLGPNAIDEYPNTFCRGEGSSEVFDPALVHYAYAFRASDPAFDNPEQGRQWYAARRAVIDHLLRQIGNSPWHEHLVLRGSLLLKAWLGEPAREPGDIDWVFRPASTTLGDLLADELFKSLQEMIRKEPDAGPARITVDGILVDDIWTYDRAPGRRIVFPWTAPGLPDGSVQMDVVFSEALPTDPISVQLPSPDGPIAVWAADQPLSLAWKLLWLETDAHPQGKDLYDATLLAERTYLPLDLLYEVLQSSDEWPSESQLTPDFADEWYVDWENFQIEYPHIEGTAQEWQERLTRALAPTFAGDNNRDRSG